MIGATALGVPAVFGTLLIVAVIACVSPLIVSLHGGLRIPAVVVEVLLGALVGPGGLAIAQPNEATRVLSFLGLGFLLFVAGLEVEPDAMARNLNKVSIAFLLSVVIALPIAFGVSLFEPISEPFLVAFALASSSLGVVIVALAMTTTHDKGFDQLVIANASIGEFGALVLIAVFFSTSRGSSAGIRIFTLAIFGVTVAVVGLVVSGVFRSAAPKISLERFRRRTWQLDIRFAILILVAFAALADELGFDGILGAFAAGVLIRIADREGIVRNRSFMDRVDAVGFGLLIPVFFITSGFDLDFRALFHSPDHLALVPIFFVGFLASRALPPLLLWRDLERRRTVAMGLLSATTLTVVVVAVDAALSLRILDSAAATALVSAALLTQVVCPPIALALMGEAPATASGVADNLD